MVSTNRRNIDLLESLFGEDKDPAGLIKQITYHAFQ